MKVKLTKKFVDSIDYTAKGTEIYMDDVLTGFALRVGNQSKHYTLHKRINGKLYEMSNITMPLHNNIYVSNRFILL